VLVAGGASGCCHGGSLASSELFDAVSGTWTTTAALAEARFGHTANFLVDGTVLAVGGSSGRDTTPTESGALASAERFDPRTATWTATGSLATGRAKHTATTLLDGTVLATPLGGLGSAERYALDGGSWLATGNMSRIRFAHTATLLADGTVLVAGGYGDQDLAAAELYEPVAGTWSEVLSMLAIRTGHTATLLADGRVLVAGGTGGRAGAPSAELYGP
jgi:hypothetical protein